MDATNVQPEARKTLIALAKEFHLFAEAIVSIFRTGSARPRCCAPGSTVWTYDELIELMAKLGYTVEEHEGQSKVSSPEGRKLVFVGDLVDHGPGTVQVLRLVLSMVASGQAFCVPGNHEIIWSARCLARMRSDARPGRKN